MNRWLALILCLTAPIAGQAVPVAFDNEDLLELQREQSKRRPAGSALASLADAIDSSSQASNRYADDRFDDGQGIATPTYWRPADSAAWAPDPTLAPEAQAYADSSRNKRSRAIDSLFADQTDASGRINWNATDAASPAAPAKRGGLFDKETRGQLLGVATDESGTDVNATTLISINGLVIDLGAVRMWNQSVRLAIRDLFQIDDGATEEELATGVFSSDIAYNHSATAESSSSTGYSNGSRSSSTSSNNRSAQASAKGRTGSYDGSAFTLSPDFIITARNVGILAACTIVLLLLLPNVFVRSSILVSATLILVILL